MRHPCTWYSVLSTQYAVLLTLALNATVAAAAPPKVNNFYPAGCQRGEGVTMTAAGEFSTWPVQIWSDRAGLTATAEKEKGKLKIEVAADAVPGVYWLRAF